MVEHLAETWEKQTVELTVAKKDKTSAVWMDYRMVEMMVAQMEIV